MLSNVLFQNSPSYIEIDLLRNESFTPQKIDFYFVISLVSVEKLVSMEDAPSVSPREER